MRTYFQEFWAQLWSAWQKNLHLLLAAVLLGMVAGSAVAYFWVNSNYYPASYIWQRVQIIALAMSGSLLLSLILVGLYELCFNPKVTRYYLETKLGIPLLGVLPWIPNRDWHKLRRGNTLEMTLCEGEQPFYQVLPQSTIENYQHIAQSLKTNMEGTEMKAITVASLSEESNRSVIVPNLGLALAQSGDKVLLIDVRLAQPCLHEAFGHVLSFEKGITELINQLSETLFLNPDLENPQLLETLKKSVLPTGAHRNLHYINAGTTLENTTEFLNSRGFYAMIALLSEIYDWILLDAPAMLSSSDTFVALNFADSSLLLVERRGKNHQLRQCYEHILQLDGHIAGAIMREGFAC